MSYFKRFITIKCAQFSIFAVLFGNYYLLAYADCFEIEALITSVGWNCDPYPAEWHQYLTRAIEAYRKDVKNLRARSGQKEFQSIEIENGKQKMGYWPSADYLTQTAMMGSINGGIRAIGKDNDSIPTSSTT